MTIASSFTTPNGEEMIVLSRKDYEALIQRIEDLEDSLSIADFERKRAAGEEELVPAEYVNRMSEGESPIRVWRDFRGMSAKDLAAAAGISTAFLSEIETGKKDGSIATLKAIADALKIDLDDLYWRQEDRKVADNA
ncbi:helix-turn-helix domain-containing protein [Rhizobium rosettiformans]|uniref:helix-turn-helix domain-containing protein n=1 Tax=Rhizobium rosettiformans TaxID=1368430 RepID=UPI0028657DA7|nr:helix-turn-helix transcriptional regulator [Rhizobium rosettiformans]MDR7029617.1 DNA-binding XRE family transcriptional regulator [Rhizobium rosettiformans]MDR7063331.1 DNA-binding XRE family transcriptional regulator [Rhizobium rosettiformans]